MQSGEISPGTVLTVFFSIVMGGMAIGQAAPSFTAFAVGKFSEMHHLWGGLVVTLFLYFLAARGAAYHLFEVIDREPVINWMAKYWTK